MKITIYTLPTPKARARTIIRNGRVMSYTPKGTVRAEESIRARLMDAGIKFVPKVPLSLHVDFFVARPKTLPKKVLYPVTRPDLDNYIKTVCDAMNKYICPDDSQIVTMVINKRYGDPPRIEIEIGEVIEV